MNPNRMKQLIERWQEIDQELDAIHEKRLQLEAIRVRLLVEREQREQQPQWTDYKGACAILGCSKSQLFKFARAGKLKYRGLARNRQFEVASCRELADSLTFDPKRQPEPEPTKPTRSNKPGPFKHVHL